MKLTNRNASSKLTSLVILTAVIISLLIVVPGVLSALSGSAALSSGFINMMPDGIGNETNYSALDTDANITLLAMQDINMAWVQLFVNCTGGDNETFYIDVDDNASSGDLGGNEFMIHTNCTPDSSAVFMYNSSSASYLAVTKDVGWITPPAPLFVNVSWNGTAPASETIFNYCSMYGGFPPAEQNLTISKNSDGTFVTLIANFTGVSCPGGGGGGGLISISINKTLINWTAYPPSFGDNVTFLLNITNNGTDNITSLHAWDTYLNTSLEYIIANVTPNGTIPYGFNYTQKYWNLSSYLPVLPNQSVLITINFTVIENWALNETNEFEVEAWNNWGINVTAFTSITIPVADSFPPIINLISPGNTSWDDGLITFSYNVSDNVGLSNCSLYINGTSNATDFSPTNDAVNSFINITMGEGTFLWNVTCSDNSSHQGWSAQTWTINIDTTPPLANLYNVTESSAYLYYNISANKLWYGTGMGGLEAFVIRVNASDVDNGLDYANGSTLLGDTPTDSTEGAAPDVYDLIYNASSADTDTGVITISVYDLVGNVNNSVIVNVDRDTTNPSVTATSVTESSQYLHSPNATTLYYSNGMGAVAHSFAWKGTASDPDVGLDQANFSSAFSDVQPADTSPANWSATYDIANVDAGTQTITITVTNDVGNSNSSVVLTAYEDLTPPSIGVPTLDVPAETNINSNIKVNATYSDAAAGVRNCIYDIINASSGAAILTNQSMDNDAGAAGTANGTIASLADALYNITVSCTDNVDNSNTSAVTQVLVDTQSPVSSVDVIAPYWHGPALVPFDVNVTASDPGNSGVVSVDLYYRYSTDNATWGAWTYNGTDNTASWNFTFNGTDGYYEFYSNATDNATNTEACGTTDAGAAIDTTGPTVTLNAPPSNINTSQAFHEFNFTPVDNLPTPITCNLTINSSYVNSTNSAINGTVNSLGYTFTVDGTYLWNVTCWDNVGNKGASAATWTITYDATAPDASGASVLIENGSTYSLNATLDFNWSGFVDTLSGIAGYYYNFTNNEGTSNGTWDLASPGQLTTPVDGNISIYVWAEDNAGNKGQAVFDSIIVDTVPPNVSSTSPTDGQLGVNTLTTISVTFTEPMNASTVNTSTFYVNGSVTGTITTTNGITYIFTPNSRLDYNKGYTVTISAGVRDVAGNNLTADYVWVFNTASRTAEKTWGGGGGGSSAYTPHFNFQYYNSTETNIKDGTTADLTFSDGERHRMAFEVGPDFIDVRIWSDEVSGRIYVGETKTFDTDSSGKAELSITLSSIEDGIAKITLSEIPEVSVPTAAIIPGEPVPEEAAEEASPAEEKEEVKEPKVQKIDMPWLVDIPNILLFVLALVIITVILVSWWYYTVS